MFLVGSMKYVKLDIIIKTKRREMRIAINVDDKIVANQILGYLQSFHKKIQIVTSGGEDISFESYAKSRQFIKDKNELHQIFDDIQSNKTSIAAVDEKFWSDMDKVIERA